MNGQTPPLLGDRYQLDTIIGRGGMAEVWRARDTRLGRDVAIKRLRVDLATDPTFQARFRREAQAAAGLNHPNIVSVYDTGEETDPASGIAVPYIVMELVQGHTLKDVLRDDRRILPERALEFTQGVLDALSYSHKSGIVHRDIKPANVMLTPTGTVKVMDFGIARAVADTSATMTQTAAVIGTAQYLSPEQARGETVDTRSDIYSAGVLLYELLVGRPPFVGDSPVSVAYQHVRETPVTPSTFDPEVTAPMDAVVMKALAKDPSDRYQTAREMRDDISRVLAGMPVAAPSPAVAPVHQPTAATAVVPQRAETPAATTAMSPVPAPATTTTSTTTSTGTLPREPEERRRTSPATVVLIVLLAALLGAIGYGIYQFTRPNQPGASSMVKVPSVMGDNQTQATSELSSNGLAATVVPTNGPTGDTVNQVVGQNPTAGSSVTPGATVTITVNVGPKQVNIPTGLVGLTAAEATKKLQAAGFKVDQQAAVNEPTSAKKGTVVTVSPDQGVPAAAGATVTIYVASGSSQVPNLSGMTVAQAKAYASTLGFTNVQQVGEEETTSATPGTIVRQNPTVGNTGVRSNVIQVWVAKAPAGATSTATTPQAPPSTPASPPSSSTTP